MADDIEANGKMSISDAEYMNQFLNDELKSTTSGRSETLKKGMQTLVSDIRTALDDAISTIP